MKQLEEKGWTGAQRGLAHSYSRAKVKFNVNRVDNMIIQAIALLDTLDKDVNTFVMRVREWYGWHFPELVKVINDNYQYARIVMLAKDKTNITDDMLDDLKEIVGDEELAKQVREIQHHFVSINSLLFCHSVWQQTFIVSFWLNYLALMIYQNCTIITVQMIQEAYEVLVCVTVVEST